MNKTITLAALLLIAITLITMPLSARGRKDTPDSSTPAIKEAGPGTATGEGRSISINYDIKKSNAGSKSEGRDHVLVINGKIVPDVFDLVYAAGVLYEFKVRTQVWGDGGYIRNEEAREPYGSSNSSISDKDWELGWYEGNKLKEGTPRSWVYITRDSDSYFVSPDEIYRLVRYKAWSFRERDTSGPSKK
jgi:hypothetical protein